LLLNVSHADAKNQHGDTALMVAAAFGRTDVVRNLLAKCRADVVNNTGKTALMLASSAGSAECVRLLAFRSDGRPSEGKAADIAMARENG
jgi:ankyrin repeat protein